jgi:hypothetical protein
MQDLSVKWSNTFDTERLSLVLKGKPEAAWSCKNYKKKCCKKYKKGDQCRRCPKLTVFDRVIEQMYLTNTE